MPRRRETVRVKIKPMGDAAVKFERHRWLELIGVLKFLKGALFVGIGFALLQMLHHDLYMLSLWAVETLHLDPDRLLIAKVLGKISLITNHRLKQLALLVFLYASLDFIEGVGLMLEKRWAEYFTLGLTIALLPLEVLKLIYHPNRWTLLILLINIVIAIYLAWLVRPMAHFAEKRTLD
jgi:uncharacterized membrane protein (DUF2068 family)